MNLSWHWHSPQLKQGDSCMADGDGRDDTDLPILLCLKSLCNCFALGGFVDSKTDYTWVCLVSGGEACCSTCWVRAERSCILSILDTDHRELCESKWFNGNEARCVAAVIAPRLRWSQGMTYRLRWTWKRTLRPRFNCVAAYSVVFWNAFSKEWKNGERHD